MNLSVGLNLRSASTRLKAKYIPMNQQKEILFIRWKAERKANESLLGVNCEYDLM